MVQMEQFNFFLLIYTHFATWKILLYIIQKIILLLLNHKQIIKHQKK